MREYKLLIANRRTLPPDHVGEGPNRAWNDRPTANMRRRLAHARFPERPWRGVRNRHPRSFSLRSGKVSASGFLDLKLPDRLGGGSTRQRVIQVLPINDTTMNGTWEDSYPYNANSSFALHPQFHAADRGRGRGGRRSTARLRDELNALPGSRLRTASTAPSCGCCGPRFAQKGVAPPPGPTTRRFSTKTARGCCPMRPTAPLRDEHGTAISPAGAIGPLRQKAVEAYCRRNSREMAFHCFVQFYLHRNCPRSAATPAARVSS